MTTLASLVLAREALIRDKVSFATGKNHTTGKFGKDPYYWCRLGWERNDFNGYGLDVSKALRPFVPGGDLTKWWMKGKNKKQMLGLFSKAIEEMM